LIFLFKVIYLAILNIAQAYLKYPVSNDPIAINAIPPIEQAAAMYNKIE